MALPVATLLKKAALAVGSNKKVLKTVSGIVLGVVLMIVMPIVAVLGLFPNGMTIDMSPLEELYEQQITEGDVLAEELEEKMADAGFSQERTDEALALYVYSLFRFSGEENFTDRLVGCFSEDQTAEELISAVNAQFGTDILTEEFLEIMEEIRGKNEHA